MKKQTKTIIILALCLIAILFATFLNFYLSEEQKLKRFCNQARDYPNPNNLEGEEYLAFSLSNLVRDTISYKFYTKHIYEPLDVWEVLETREGECSAHALLFYECCRFLDLTCDIIRFKSEDNLTTHFWNTVTIDGKIREIDSYLSENKDYYIFIKGIWGNEYWDKRIFQNLSK